MKTLLFIVLVCGCTTLCLAQDPIRIGVSVAGATSKSMMIDLFGFNSQNRYHLGFSFQFGGQKGKSVDDKAVNYGDTEDGKGDYFFTVDLGYSLVIKDKFTVQPEVSIGQRKHYTNFVDRRFSSDRYHLITKKESIVGAGVNLGYIFHENFEGFGGFNSIRGATLGIRLII